MSVLWDADPNVCCAAFQLGACAHTEAPDEDDFEPLETLIAPAIVLPDDDKEPF